MLRGSAIFATALVVVLAATTRLDAEWHSAPGIRWFRQAFPMEERTNRYFETMWRGRRVDTWVWMRKSDPNLFGQTGWEGTSWHDHERGGYFRFRPASFDDGINGRVTLMLTDLQTLRRELESAWEAGPFDRGQRGVKLMISESVPELVVFNYDPEWLARDRRGEQSPPTVVHPDGFIMPLRTRAEGKLAAELLLLHLLGKSEADARESSWRSRCEDVVLGVVERTGLPALVAVCVVTALLACLLWIWFGRQISGVIRRYRCCLPQPVRFAAWFAIAPGWSQRRALHSLERQLSAALLREAQEAAERRRTTRLATRRSGEHPILPPPAPAPPSPEAIAGLAEAIRAGLLRPELGAKERDEVAAELAAALEQRSRNRALRMLEHAHDRLEQAIADAESGKATG